MIYFFDIDYRQKSGVMCIITWLLCHQFQKNLKNVKIVFDLLLFKRWWLAGKCSKVKQVSMIFLKKSQLIYIFLMKIQRSKPQFIQKRVFRVFLQTELSNFGHDNTIIKGFVELVC